MSKDVQDNFDRKNIKNIDKLIEEDMAERVGMFVDESGKGKVEITEESRKKCAKNLLR